MKSLFFVVLAIFSSGIFLSAQDCTGFHQYHCDYADYTYFYSRQSKSMLFKPGQTTELNIVAYGGEDYFISVCAHRKLGNIQFKILEDNADRSLIYDNSMDEFSTSIYFSNDITRNLILEVHSTAESLEDDEGHCLGVIIQFKKNE
jgi:hypothetical protein